MRAAILIWAAAVTWLGAEVVDVRPRIACRDGAVRLGDVVSFPEQFAEAERELVIGDGAAWEHGQEVSLRTLAYLLQRHESLRRLQLRGPAYIQIVRLASEAQVQMAREAILDELSRRPPWRDWEIDLQLSAADELALAHAGAFTAIRLVTPAPGATLGRVNLTLTAQDASNSDLNVRVSPRLLRQVTRVVLTARQPAGRVLEAGDVTVKTVWVEDDRQEFVETAAECIGYQLDRQMNEGDPVRHASLRRPMCAERGQDVWVTCVKGPLSVTLAAVADESGRQGDEIRLHNRLTGKVFRAVLTASRSAVLQIGGVPANP